MGARDTYAIVHKPELSEDHYSCIKYGPDGEMVDEYLMHKKANSFTCACPARKPWCRHKEMFTLFNRMRRIGTGWTYSYDKQKWIEPIDLGEM